ncbi:MAG TPA: response regulator, partial [Deinococcales bacterium]|nr:response regulator [Deinococcales bacterium]
MPDGTVQPAPNRVIVLVVDDSDANRYALSRTLERAGYRVVEASNGGEGIALAHTRPDLIILDVNLPDVNGFEVCRRLKADPAVADIPVLQMSASFVRGSDRAQGLDAGADGYLVQPVEPPELLATVRSLLRTREVEEELRRLNATLESRVLERTAAADEARREAEALLELSRSLDRAATVDEVAELALSALSSAM